MKTDDLLFNPFKFYMTATAAMIDMSRAVQDAMVRQVESAAREEPVAFTWSKLNLPMPDLAANHSEERMREAFHYAADLNLRAWENAANLLAALPAWSRNFYKTPGTALTDWFDQARETANAFQPANDSWADAAHAAPEPAPAAAPVAKTQAEPKASPTPVSLDKPNGAADDLTAIKGIGPKLSEKLNGLGVWHYAQIADWTAEHAAWIDDQLAFKGRVARENWIVQAKSLAGDKAA